MPHHSNIGIDTYRHLNTDTPIKVICGNGTSVHITGDDGMKALVHAIIRSNYGLHRFLSMYVNEFEDDESEEFTIMARQFLEEGGY